MSARPHTRPLAPNRPPRSGNRYPRWLAAALALVLTLTLVLAAGAIAADLLHNLEFDNTVTAVGFSVEPGTTEALPMPGSRVGVLIPMGTLLVLLLGAITVMLARRRVDSEEHTL